LTASRSVSAAAAVYLAVAVAVTYPLCWQLGTAVVHDPGDPILNTWLLWWNAHNWPLTANWWNAPNFYPMHATLAFSETLAGLSPVTSPIIWITGNPLFAYNVVFLLSFPASALAAWWLCWTLTAREDAALLAGLAFGFAPYRIDQLPHLQILATWWMPLALGAAHRHLETGQRRWLVLLAVSWMLLGATNGYVLLFFAVVFAAWVLWFATLDRIARVGAIVTAWVVGVLPIVPILLKYRDVHRSLEFQRPYGEIVSLSADLLSAVRGSDLLAIGHLWLLPASTESNLFPGVVVGLGVPLGLWLAWRRGAALEGAVGLGPWRVVFRVALAVAILLSIVPVTIAMIGPWRIEWGPLVFSALGGRRAAGAALSAWVVASILSPPVLRLWWRRSVPGFYLLSSVFVWLLALGPEIRLQGTTLADRAPYFWLMRLPGFDGLRAPGRFAFLATLTLAVCGALLFVRVVSARASARWAVVALLGVGIVADSWLTSLPLIAPPRPLQLLQSTARGPVLELPFGHAERDIAAMYRQMSHGQPLVNGFSGYLAPYYDILEIALEKDRDHEALAQLAARGLKYVVVDQRSDPDGVREQFAASAPFARFVARQNDHVLFSLGDPGSTISTLTLDETTRVDVQAMVDEQGRSDGVMALTDGNPLTAWQSAGPQAGHETLTLSLNEPAPLSALVVTHGPYRGGFARRLVVETSLDGRAWAEQYSGRILPLLIGGVIDDPRLGLVRIDLHGATARYVRLRQTGEVGQTGESTWAMADLAIYRAR
jgi:hypothetical protein